MIGVDERGRGLGLGFALLGSAVAWTGHLLSAWAISEFGCTLGGAGTFLGIDGITAALLGVSAGALALSAASTGYAIALKRLVGPNQAGDVQDPVPSLARVGWMVGALFTVTIAAQSLPIAWFAGGCW